MPIQIDVKKPEALQVTIWGKTMTCRLGEAYIVDRWLTLSVRADAFLPQQEERHGEGQHDVRICRHDLQGSWMKCWGMARPMSCSAETPSGSWI
jgi:hypothetical protein